MREASSPCPCISISMTIIGKSPDLGNYLETRLGLQETFVTRYGQIVPKRPEIENEYWFRLVRENSWSLERTLEKAILKLAPKREDLLDLVQNHGFSISFEAVLEIEDVRNRPVISLNSEQIRFLSDVHAPFSVDII